MRKKRKVQRMIKKQVDIIGAGLAGCEAAFQLAKYGIQVRLFEMKPKKMSPAHKSGMFAELVCSNSLRSDRLSNAVGLLKEEMRSLGSLVMEAAETTQVPAGGALAVNREEFAKYITDQITANPNIDVVSEEVTSLKAERERIQIIASGPLTSDALAESIRQLTGQEYLHFFDAAAPIIEAQSIDMEHAFVSSRYGRGNDYVNCPMTKEEYDVFYEALIHAECAQMSEFENEAVFEGCMPIETMAKRGYKTMLFGPLKPKGLEDPKTGREPYAVLQLRKEDRDGSMYNLVGFQTHLKFPEQRRVFSLIPALHDAEFLRYGVMHKNTFINAPKLLDNRYRLKNHPHLRFAGQITGVEGYVESAASGLLCGLYTALEMLEIEASALDNFTALGALGDYVSNAATTNYQPMNINFGIMKPLEQRIRNKEEKNTRISERALEKLEHWKLGLDGGNLWN